jgi:hypothetical protein
MAINELALRMAKNELKSLGNLNDFPADLRNTLANLFYKHFGGLKTTEYESMINTSDTSAYFEETVHVKTHYEIAKGVIQNLRRVKDEDGDELFVFGVKVTQDIFKYRIPDAQNKTVIRRAIERKFSKPVEIPNLYSIIMDLEY